MFSSVLRSEVLLSPVLTCNIAAEGSDFAGVRARLLTPDHTTERRISVESAANYFAVYMRSGFYYPGSRLEESPRPATAEEGYVP